MTQPTATDMYVPTDVDVAHYREHGWWVSPKIVPDDVLDAAQLGGERHYAGERDYPLLITGGYLDWRPEHGEMIRLNDYVSLQNEELRQLTHLPVIAAIAGRWASCPSSSFWSDT